MKYIEPFIAVYKKMSDWPIYKLSQDRRQFIAEIDDFTTDRLITEHTKLYDLLVQTLYQERIRLKETPWKVDPPNDRQFLDRIRTQLVQSETESKPKAAETHREIVRKFVHRYSEEIVGTFSIPTMKFARQFLSIFFNRLLNAATERWWRFLSSKSRLHERIQVYGDVQAIQDLFSQGTVIVVPTHFSNLDSVLIGFAMDQIMGLPQFSYGAGLNLYNSGAAAFFMNRLGAYRVDRRKKNTVYLETLKAMSNLSIQRGTNTLFFPGGTRSRSGEVEKKLKMGLLGTAVEAQRSLSGRGDKNKIFIVPLTTSYHTVLEAPFLIHQHLQIVGKERYLKGRSEGNSFREWFKFIWQFFAKRSDIVLSFGKPIDVMGNFVDTKGISHDSRGNVLNIADYFITEGVIKEDLQREAEYTKLLADKIVDRFYKENIVLSSHVVAFTAFNMLKASNDKLDLYALLRLSPDDYIFPLTTFTAAVTAVQTLLIEFEEKGRLKLSDAIRLSPEELVQDGMKNLGVYHVRKPLLFNRKGDIESDDFNVLFFYHNRLENFGLTKRVRWDKFQLVVKDFVEPAL
ncbi:MAG: 1-acyl-sn-glycerol-3-phosphate acyltransferase [Saprospiraceae bacterium]|nr:1-acyl-sn-glycerol-3-phosphate acyltransferase [Saprospiraceae bacterium]